MRQAQAGPFAQAHGLPGLVLVQVLVLALALNVR